MTVRVEFLASHPEEAQNLGRLHHAEWGDLYAPQWSLEEAIAELEDHALRRDLPTTLVAMEEDRLIGSVALIEDELPHDVSPELRTLGPWLASLYVLPERRGRGLGKRLVAAVEAFAQTQGQQRLYLFTEHQEQYYLPLGWFRYRRFLHRERPVSILQRDLP
jgi:predicted N-acetyltransferase YhbS